MATSASASPGPGEMVCPDPSAHDHSKHSNNQAASKAALLVTRAQRGGSVESNDGRPASTSASHNLKYAKAQDLPSFPSRGATSGAAFAAAVLAKDYTMKDLWQPETSTAGSKAAMLAHKDGGNVDLWHPSASAAGNSAASIAMRNKGLSPEVDRGYTDTGRNNSLLAAAKSAQMGRQRAGSTPTAPPPKYPDSHNSSRNALNAATASHRLSTRAAPDGWDSEAMQAARIKNVGNRMDREMFGEHPPVEPELEEQRRKAALRASAVSMAKQMYEYQNRAATPTDTNSVVGSAGHGAEVAHRRNKSSTSQPDVRDEALRYIHLQDTAHRIAQERLAKMEQDNAAGRYREYYGYGNSKSSPKKSRLSIRRRTRASSEGQYFDDSSDEEQARRIRSQMSQLSTAQDTVADRQRQDDRARLLAAAEKRVQARMHDMDEKVFLETGKVSQAMMDEWEAKAREKANRDKQERDRDAPPGKTHIGGGKYMDKAEIEAIAAARLKGTLDEITENAERMRARDEELARKRDEAETQRMQEKMDEEGKKAEFKRIKEQDKANARREKAEREAAARKEKQDRKIAADKEKEERKAAQKAEKAQREEEKRRSRDEQRKYLYSMAGGAAVGEAASKTKEEREREEKEAKEAQLAGADTLSKVATKVKEDKEREERRDEESQLAGADALSKVATKVKEDKENEERREAEATVAGGVALGEVAEKVKDDKEREERRDQEAQVAGANALAKVATNLKEEQEKAGKRKSREAKRNEGAAVAGGAALAEIAGRVRRDTELEKRRQSAESQGPSDRDKEIAGAGAAATVVGTAGVVGYEAVEHDDRDTGPAPNTIGPHESDIANVLDPRVGPDFEKQKEKEPLTFGPHRSDIANIVDPRVDSEAPKKADEEEEEVEEPMGDEGMAIAAVSGGVVAAGAAGAVVEEQKERPAPAAAHATEQPKEKRGMFSRLSRRLKSKSGDSTQRPTPISKPKEDPSTEAADGAGAAGIPILPVALAAAGGTDEQRGEAESEPEVSQAAAAVADEKDDEDDDIDRSKAAEALISVGAAGAAGAGIAAAVAAERSGHPEEHEEKAEISSLDSTDDENDNDDLQQYTTAEHSGAYVFATQDPPARGRPDLERHISTIETSSESDYDGDDDDDEQYDYEDRAGISRVTAESPDFEEERGRSQTITAPPPPQIVTQTASYEDERSRSPVSPITPQNEIIITRADAGPEDPHIVVAPIAATDHEPAAPPAAAKAVASEDEKTASQPEKSEKESKGIKGIFRKLKSKPDERNKLSKRRQSADTASVESAKSVPSAKEAAVVEPPAAAPSLPRESEASEDKDGVVTPVTTTSAGLAADQGLVEGTVEETQRLSTTEPPDSPSSFRRHDAALRDPDEVSSSGAEEEDVKVGRRGRLARKLGLSSNKGKEREPGKFGSGVIAGGSKSSAGGNGSGNGNGNGTDADDDQFEEAQDHFDESLAPPPAFAGQARHDTGSPARETKFQENL